MAKTNVLELKGISRVISHFVFWLLSFFFLLVLFGHQYGNYASTILFVLVILFVTIGTTYFTNYYLIPQYLFKGKYAYFILYIIYAVLISVYFEILFSFLYVFKVYQFREVLDPSVIDLFFLMVGTFFIVLMAVGIKMVKRWMLNQQKTQIIAREKVETELKLLKAQIHPHFLFNTLNNIYALALEKSEKTADVIVKLSDILDYLLYETKADFVPLKKEVDLINNYLELEMLRYGNRLKLDKNISTDIDDYKIAPLMLLPFVENAFKHGASKKREEVHVSIKLVVENKSLYFYMENDIPATKESAKNGGIGLQNVKTRLNIAYNNNYNLDIAETSDKFKVKLELNLDKDEL